MKENTENINDGFLKSLVIMTNNFGLTIEITLTINGHIITGTLISQKKYFCDVTKLILENLKDSPNNLLETVVKSEYDNAEETFYIHLINAYYILDNRNPKEGHALWRGKLSDVSSFSLNSTSL